MTENITIEEFKAEAIRRMEKLNLDPYIIEEFKNDGRITCSEVHNPSVFTDLPPKVENPVNWLAKTKQGVVYHVTKTNATFFGMPVEMYNLFYVNSYREGWKIDKRIFRDKLVFCIVLD